MKSPPPSLSSASPAIRLLADRSLVNFETISKLSVAVVLLGMLMAAMSGCGGGADVKSAGDPAVAMPLCSDDNGASAEGPATPAATAANLIRNPSMSEVGEEGGPKDWIDYSWGQNTRTLSVAQDASGNAFARMEIESMTGGWVRFGQKMTLEPGKTYRASVRLRSDKPDLGMRFGIVNQEAPYPEVFGETIVVDDNWNEYSAIFDCTARHEQLHFWVGTTTRAEFAIDDASVIELTSLESAAPPIAGNLIVQGSFEGGLDYHWGFRHRSRNVVPTPTQANAADGLAELELLRSPPKVGRVENGAHGSHALSIEMPPQTYCMIRSVPFTANYGRIHHLRLFARKTGGSARIDFGIGSDKNQFMMKRTVTPSDAWASHELKGTPRINTRSRYYATINIVADDAPVTVLLDGLSLVESADAVFAERFPVEMYVRSEKVGNLFLDTDAPAAGISLFGVGEDVPPGILDVTLTDIFGGRQELPTMQVAGGTRTVDVPLPLDKRPSGTGIFKANVTYRAAGGLDLASPGEYIFTVIPDLSAKTEFDMPFGTHADAVPDDLDILWQLGFRWLRFHDGTAATTWWNVERARGEFTFCDEVVQRVRTKGFRIMSMLSGTPKWAAAPGAGNFIPADAADWETYVRTVTTRYRDVIDAYEVQNEPFYHWLKYADAKSYVRLMDIARAEAKKNHARTIGLCASTHDRTWPTAVFAAGGLNRYDIFSFHGYVQEMLGSEQDHLSEGLAYFHDEARKNGGAMAAIWDTEGGSRSYASWYDAVQVDKPPLSHFYNVKHLVASYVMRQALGVEKFFVYTAHAGRSPLDTASYTILEHDRSAPKPAAAAIPFLFDHIYGFEPASTALVDGVRFVEYRSRAGGTKVRTVAWSVADNRTLRFTSPVDVVDVMGNRRGAMSEVLFAEFPFYLESDAPTAAMVK